MSDAARTARVPLATLLDAPRDPRTVVCRAPGVVRDWAAFTARVASIAAFVDAAPARRYALCIDDPFDFACALFALLACGKEPSLPANAMPGYLGQLADRYDVLLTDADLVAIPASPAGDSAHSRKIDPQARLTLFTSGSSGTPKAIGKTLAQFDAEVNTLEGEWGARFGTATVLASVPHHHIYGLLFRVLWPLATGRAFDREISLEPLHLHEQLARCDADEGALIVSTPAQLSRWPALPGFDTLPAPRAIFSSGGALAASTAGEYTRRFGVAPYEIFGSTETGGIAWRRQSETDAWQLFRGIDVDREKDGALRLRSPHLAEPGWYRADDRVSFDVDGRFRLQGRLDRVLKLDGKRVSLPEIEARLAQHAWVAQAALVPLDGANRQRLGALVALTADGAVALREQGRVALGDELRRHLADFFDVVVLPRHWRFCMTLPFDERGKLPAARVAAAFAPRADGADVLAQAREGDAWHVELRANPSLAHFGGHFPGLPILPGVVQVDWAMRLAAEHMPQVRDVESVDRLKFTAPVKPGAFLNLTLTHDAAKRRVQFTYRLEGRECASGVFVYREPA